MAFVSDKGERWMTVQERDTAFVVLQVGYVGSSLPLGSLVNVDLSLLLQLSLQSGDPC